MDFAAILNIMAFAALLLVGVVPLYIAATLKVRSLRILSLLLGLFAEFHGVYHLLAAYGQYDLGAGVFQPISVAFLLAFGLYFSKKGVP